MTHEVVVESRNQDRRAVLSEGDDGVEARYYLRVGRGWAFDRACTVRLPMHAALDLACQIVNRAPPRVEMR